MTSLQPTGIIGKGGVEIRRWFLTTDLGSDELDIGFDKVKNLLVNKIETTVFIYIK